MNIPYDSRISKMMPSMMTFSDSIRNVRQIESVKSIIRNQNRGLTKWSIVSDFDVCIRLTNTYKNSSSSMCLYRARTLYAHRKVNSRSLWPALERNFRNWHDLPTSICFFTFSSFVSVVCWRYSQCDACMPSAYGWINQKQWLVKVNAEAE